LHVRKVPAAHRVPEAGEAFGVTATRRWNAASRYASVG